MNAPTAAARAELLRRAIAVLARSDDTTTGVTLVFQDGTATYIPRAIADAMAGTAKPDAVS